MINQHLLGPIIGAFLPHVHMTTPPTVICEFRAPPGDDQRSRLRDRQEDQLAATLDAAGAGLAPTAFVNAMCDWADPAPLLTARPAPFRHRREPLRPTRPSITRRPVRRRNNAFYR